MRVYEITGNPGYGTCLGMVAAESPRAAIALIKKTSYWSEWITDITATRMRDVSYEGTKSKVLAETCYIE